MTDKIKNDTQAEPVASEATKELPPKRQYKFCLKDLDELIRDLYFNHPFYGYTLNKLNRKISDRQVSTACIDFSTMTLVVNPAFVEDVLEKAKDPKQCKLLILMHEVLHVGLLHYSRFKHILDSIPKNETLMYHTFMNYGTDCSIDELIGLTKHFKEGISKKSIEDMVNKKLEPKMEAEYYFKAMLEKKEEIAQKAIENMMKNMSPEMMKHLQDHFSDSPPEEGDEGKSTMQKAFEKYVKEHMKQAKDFKGDAKKKMEKFMKEAKRRQKDHDKKCGTEPGNSICSVLPSYDEPVHKKIFEKLIDKVFGDEPTADKDYFYGQQSRRFADSFWYTKPQLVSPKLYFAVDSSGSMGDDELGEILGYASKGLKKYNCEATLIVCDTEITKVVPKLRRISKTKEMDVPGRGGTDLTKILDYIEMNEGKNVRNTRLVLLTDGCTPWRSSKVRTSVVYTKNHQKMKNIYNSAILGEEDVEREED